MAPPAPARTWEALPANLRGALWLLLASSLFAVMAALIKTLGQRLPSYELVFFRSIVLIALTFPVLLRAGSGGLRTERPALHAVRATLALISVNCTFYALATLPLADVVSISFSRALFLTVLAVVVLGETVGRYRWTATAIGFVGVLVVMRPSPEGLPLAALAAVVAAAAVAGLSTTVRLLSSTESNAAMMAYPALLIAVVTAVPVALTWVDPTPREWALVLAMCLVGAAAQWSIIQGFRIGEASALAPITYVRLLLAIGIGVVFFAEVPDAATWIGSAIIVASTLYTMHREARLGRARARAGPYTD